MSTPSSDEADTRPLPGTDQGQPGNGRRTRHDPRRARLHLADEVDVAAGWAASPPGATASRRPSAAIEERGGKLVDAYVTLGRYDVVEIFEAPDDETAAQILLDASRHGRSPPRRCAASRATKPRRSSEGI